MEFMLFYVFRHAETFKTKNSIPYGDEIESAQILPEGVLMHNGKGQGSRTRFHGEDILVFQI